MRFCFICIVGIAILCHPFGMEEWGAADLFDHPRSPLSFQIQSRVEAPLMRVLEEYRAMPNTPATWERIEQEAEFILDQAWQAGWLMGSRPDEAYTVSCGLGKTMTSEDVRAGLLILAVSFATATPPGLYSLTFREWAL